MADVTSPAMLRISGHSVTPERSPPKQIYENVLHFSPLLRQAYVRKEITRPHVNCMELHDNLKCRAGGDQFSSKVTRRPFSPSPMNFHILCCFCFIKFTKVQKVYRLCRGQKVWLACVPRYELCAFWKRRRWRWSLSLTQDLSWLIRVLTAPATRDWKKREASSRKTVNTGPRDQWNAIITMETREPRSSTLYTSLPVMTVNKWAGREEARERAKWQLNKHRFISIAPQFSFLCNFIMALEAVINKSKWVR